MINGGSRGFTLIEMLVVLTLMGAFLSLVSHNNARIVDRSRDVALMKELSHLRTAVHQSVLDHGNQFPPNLAALNIYLGKTSEYWRGSRGSGRFRYDPESGAITLADQNGLRSTIPDAKGTPYGEY